MTQQTEKKIQQVDWNSPDWQNEQQFFGVQPQATAEDWRKAAATGATGTDLTTMVYGDPFTQAQMAPTSASLQSSPMDTAAYKDALAETGQPFIDAQRLASERLAAGASGVWSDDQFNQITEYYKRPGIEASKQRLQSLADQMRAQGVWDSSTRGEKQLEAFRAAEREMAENIDVPMLIKQLEEKENAARANIDQAGALGSQGFSQYLASAQLQLQEQIAKAEATGDWDGVKTLAQQQLALQEKIDQQKIDIDKQLADLQGKIAEAEATGDWEGKDTLEAQRLALEKQKTEAEYTGLWSGRQTLSAQQLKMADEQFKASLDNQKSEFAQQFGLSRDQFDQAAEEFRLGRLDQLDQFAKQYGLSTQELAQRCYEYTETQREQRYQFDETLKFQQAQAQTQKDQFAEQLGLDRAKFDQAAKEFDLTYTQAAEQFAKQYGLEAEKFGETQRQFDLSEERARNEYAGQLGLSRDQFDEQVRQFDEGLSLESEQVRNGVEQFKREMEFKETSFAEELGLSREQFNAATSQFNQELDQRKEEFSKNTGLAWEQFKEQQDQFDESLKSETEKFQLTMALERETLDFQKSQFAQSHDLDVRQFDEACRLNDANIRIEDDKMRAAVEQFDANLQLQRDQMDAQADQFFKQLQVEKDRIQGELGISRSQLDEVIRAAKENNTTRLAELAAQTSISQLQLAQAADQYTKSMEASVRNARAEYTGIWLDKGYVHAMDNYTPAEIQAMCAALGISSSQFINAAQDRTVVSSTGESVTVQQPVTSYVPPSSYGW